MVDPEAALLDAWGRWDEKPGREDRAREMEVTCRAVAEQMGLSSNAFRERLTAARRRGLSRSAALAEVLASR